MCFKTVSLKQVTCDTSFTQLCHYTTNLILYVQSVSKSIYAIYMIAFLRKVGL